MKLAKYCIQWQNVVSAKFDLTVVVLDR